MKKYSHDDILVITPSHMKERLLERPEMVFRLGKPNAIELVEGIVAEALVLNAIDLGITRISNWYIISSSLDWLKECNQSTVKALFEELHAFPEGGPNSSRYEFFLKIFANDVFTVDDEGVAIIKGEVPEQLIKHGITLTSNKKRVIGFRFLSGA